MQSGSAIPLGYADETLHEPALELARRYHLTLDNTVLPRLCLTPGKLVLLAPGFLPLFADFSEHAAWHKRKGAGKKQGLIRACKPVAGMKILDATAGWGRDAAMLASFGAEVTMVERNPIMAALLEDALQRLNFTSPLTGLLLLKQADAQKYLQGLDPSHYPEVIYLDPMHPEREKSALVKKEMQVLHQLIGMEEDAEGLLRSALTRARQRVVVKWPQRATPILAPDISYPGKTIRFDVYCSKIP